MEIQPENLNNQPTINKHTLYEKSESFYNLRKKNTYNFEEKRVQSAYNKLFE